MQKRGEGYQVSRKEDGTFVTSIDVFASKYIKSALRGQFGKDTNVISEENEFWENKQNERDEYFLIDPIDGTSFFIRGGDFCVNVAYIVNGTAVFGAICIPTKKEVFFSDENSVYKQTPQGVVRLLPQFNHSDQKPDYAMISNRRSIARLGGTLFNAEDMENRLELMKVRISNKLTAVAAIKYCLLLEGLGDFAVSFGTVSSWDIAAACALCKSMGIHFTDNNGNNFKFDFETKSQTVFASGYDFLHQSIIRAFKDPVVY